ncbi:hypothetical protein K458DRAFT_412244 [Lentithecium fluviatile CBS 122367]|uniref:Uncharacterized protein n=1 Tax=Lentithecium fluviatile CBS 122367 TaxID=1168545 RepID=A0A6G1JL76_9PLEO|nr:hypothetical protein K458DRAFT_412244 [Lentithecium fluviatile CBS 122367]
MADSSGMPLHGAQSTIASSEPDGSSFPPDNEVRKALVKMWLKIVQGEVSKDEAHVMLEHGPDKINCMFNAVDAAGTDTTATVSASLRQLPLDQRRDMVAEIWDEILSEKQRKVSKNFTPSPHKRRHQDMVTPSTSATTSSSSTLPSGASSSLRSTPSPPNKRPRTGAESSTSSPRVNYYCPFCHKTRKNDKQKHIGTHLVESCSSLSPKNHTNIDRLSDLTHNINTPERSDSANNTNTSDRSNSAYLFGCGFCGPTGPTLQYYGEAHLGLEELTQHVASKHKLSQPSKPSWDINNVFNNVLTHKVFSGTYDSRRAQDYPHVTSMSWTSWPETKKLLYKLEELGGRSMDASGNFESLNSEGMEIVDNVLAAATVPIGNAKSNLRTTPHPPHPPLLSTGHFVLGSQPDPFTSGPTSTAIHDYPGVPSQAYTNRQLNPDTTSALAQGTHFDPPNPPDPSIDSFRLNPGELDWFQEPPFHAPPDNTDADAYPNMAFDNAPAHTS